MKPAAAALTGRGFGGQLSGWTAPFLHSVTEWLRTGSGRTALTGVVFFVLYVAWLFADPTNVDRTLTADLWSLPLAAAAAWSAWSVSRIPALEPRLRRGWRMCALAFLGYTVGNAWWLVQENVFGFLPPASWIDIVYLSYYPLLFAGLLSFPTVPRTRAESIKLALDVATVMLAGGAVIWHFILAPALRDPATNTLETIVTVSYPIGDVVLLFGSALALLHRPAPSGRRALSLLAIGGLVVFFTDLAYGHIVLRDGTYVSGGVVDLGWQIAALLWFLPAQHQRFSIGRSVPLREHQDAHYAGVSLLPYLALLAGFVMLVQVARPFWSLSLAVVIGTVLLLSAIVVLRQAMAARENDLLVAERTAREARFRSMVQHSSDVISIVDRRGTLKFISPAVGRVFRWHADGLIGSNIVSLMHPDDVASARIFLRNLAERPGETSSFVCRLRDGDGHWKHVESMCTSLLDDPTVAGLVLNTRDVSDRTRLEAELTRRAFNDPLTGLANRVRFHAMTEQALRKPHERSAHVAVVYLDLDNFKGINDRMGHLHGDQLLIEVAARLLNATRGCDTVSRLGGDEFAVLLEGLVQIDDAVYVAERITRAMERPFRLGSSDVVIGASIGIALERPGVTAEELLRDADVAMYVAKRDGKGRYTIFEPAMQRAVRHHQELEADLRHALDRNEFRLVFQPVVNLREGHVVGCEALLRWEHPVRGTLAPDAFITAAYDTGLIAPIGVMVLNRACQQLAEWHRLGPEFANLTVAVNVAGRQIQSDGFAAEVAAALDASGVPPTNLILEITEGEIMQDTQATLARLHALKALGIRIAIDDFGTGYSSLSYLQRFPVDILKIDKTFIDQVAFQGHGQALARMIVGLGESLGLSTVAEGIQDARQAEAVLSMRCKFGQGYFFSPPVPAPEFTTLVLDLARQSPRLVTAGPGGEPASPATALSAIRSFRESAA